MENTVKFAAYGTLRRGNYNYQRFKEAYSNEFEYVKTVTSDEKFVMLTNGVYPLLCRNKKGHEPTRIVFDIISCSEECYKQIQAMEFGAGYDEDKVTIEGQSYNIFVFNHETNYKQVKTGDWNNQVEPEEVPEPRNRAEEVARRWASVQPSTTGTKKPYNQSAGYKKSSSSNSVKANGYVYFNDGTYGAQGTIK